MEAEVAKGEVTALQASREQVAGTFSGYLMLLVLLLSIAATGLGIARLANEDFGALTLMMVIGAPIVMILVVCGFYMLQPNQAAAITMFGAYHGTDRTNGLRWVWPWMMRSKVSVRSNN